MLWSSSKANIDTLYLHNSWFQCCLFGFLAVYPTKHSLVPMSRVWFAKLSFYKSTVCPQFATISIKKYQIHAIAPDLRAIEKLHCCNMLKPSFFKKPCFWAIGLLQSVVAISVRTLYLLDKYQKNTLLLGSLMMVHLYLQHVKKVLAPILKVAFSKKREKK